MTTNSPTPSPDALVIERSFDAPVDLLWRMWTVPEHFAAWYGPDGASVPDATLDVRVGGTRRVCIEMRTPDGQPMRMWFTGEFREVVENRRLVYTESVAGEDGTPGGHGATEVVVELEDLGGHTRMVMTHHGVPGDSAGAAGWGMAFDKLGALVGSPASPRGRTR